MYICGMELMTSTYQKEIAFTLSCYDRLILTGNIPELSFSGGMTNYLYNKGVKIFDYPRFAEPFKEQIRSNIEQRAQAAGVSIEFIRKSSVRKESIIAEKIKERGSHPGKHKSLKIHS